MTPDEIRAERKANRQNTLINLAKVEKRRAKEKADKKSMEAIAQKAIDKGWDYMETCQFNVMRAGGTIAVDRAEGLSSSWIEWMFRHDFAKALWGDEPYMEADTHVRVYANQAWQYHLQQMVVSEDRVKYLEENT